MICAACSSIALVCVLCQGVPTHDAEGKEVSKGQRKKLEKELEKHTAAFLKATGGSA